MNKTVNITRQLSVADILGLSNSIPLESPSWTQNLRTRFQEEPDFDLQVARQVMAVREYFEGEFVSDEQSAAHLQDSWRANKQLIEEEISSIPTDLLSILFQDLYAKGIFEMLPPGHGAEHLMSELRTLYWLIQEYEQMEVDEVEQTILLFASVFHDLGTAILDRYSELKMFTSHAEGSAFLFQNLFESCDIKAPAFCRAVMYAMAAHTFYGRDVDKVRDGKLFVQPKYPKLLVGIDGNLRAIDGVRAVDRMQMKSHQMTSLFRNIIVMVKPISDISVGGEFNVNNERDGTDFQYRFAIPGTDMSWLPEVEKAPPTMLDHIMAYQKNYEAPNAYTMYDTEWFKSSNKRSREILEWLMAGMQQIANLTIMQAKFLEKKHSLLAKFYDFIECIDPGAPDDSGYTISELLTSKFELLPENIQAAWLWVFDEFTSPEGMYLSLAKSHFIPTGALRVTHTTPLLEESMSPNNETPITLLSPYTS
jgi:hypothetical protein